MSFRTQDGSPVPMVTAAQMREVDRIAVEDFGLSLLQMMENAGRNLAGNILEMLKENGGKVVVLAGSGGNGGGGICATRHLHNRRIPVSLILSGDEHSLSASAASQLRILQAAGAHVTPTDQAEEVIRDAALVVDALIGYSLRGAPRGRAAELISVCNQLAARTISLDVPSGLDATTGQSPGLVIQAERTLTLALPKTGLAHIEGEIQLADIGIPPEVYTHLDISFTPPFGERYWISLHRDTSQPPQ